MKIKYLLLILLVLPFVFAMMPYPYPDTGVNQYYSVNFDGEGEATIAAKFEIQNNIKDDLNEIQLEIPGRQVRMINIFQEVYEYEEVCSNWIKVCNKDNTNCELQCERYYKNQIWPPKYKKIDYSIDQLSESNLYKLNLPVKIAEGEKATIILYYKSGDYTTENIGSWGFNFETIKINYDTNYINVGISVDSKLHLKGIRSDINYIDNNILATKEFASASSDELSRFSGYIGSGYYNENANSLDPMESFSAKGSYSASVLGLYIKEITASILILAGLISIFLYSFTRIKNKNKNFVLYGLGSAFVSIMLWVLSYFLLKFLNTVVYYPMYPVVSFIFILIVAILSLFVVLGPVIYFGFKHGLREVAIYSVSFICSLIIFGTIAIIILYLLNPMQTPIYRTIMEGIA